MAAKKRILFFTKIECNFAVVERIYQRLARDERLEIRFTSKNEFDGRSNRMFRRMGRSDLPAIHPTLARFRRWDLYISPDILMMAGRARFRIHTFHGVSFKGKAFTEKVLKFDRLFIVGPYMKRRFTEKGILAENDPRLAMVGMPKLDPLVDGSLQKIAYLVTIPLTLLQAYTGFAIYGPTMDWAFFTGGLELVGGPMNMRIIHYFGMWVFIVFTMIHAYLANIYNFNPSKIIFAWKETEAKH